MSERNEYRDGYRDGEQRLIGAIMAAQAEQGVSSQHRAHQIIGSFWRLVTVLWGAMAVWGMISGKPVDSWMIPVLAMLACTVLSQQAFNHYELLNRTQ